MGGRSGSFKNSRKGSAKIGSSQTDTNILKSSMGGLALEETLAQNEIKAGHYIASDGSHVISHTKGLSVRFYNEKGKSKYEAAVADPPEQGGGLGYISGNLSSRTQLRPNPDYPKELNDRYIKAYNSTIDEYQRYIKNKK